jgi:hypothetical protein
LRPKWTDNQQSGQRTTIEQSNTQLEFEPFSGGQWELSKHKKKTLAQNSPHDHLGQSWRLLSNGDFLLLLITFERLISSVHGQQHSHIVCSVLFLWALKMYPFTKKFNTICHIMA